MKSKSTKINCDEARHCKGYAEISELGADGAPLSSFSHSSSSADTSTGDSKEERRMEVEGKSLQGSCFTRESALNRLGFGESRNNYSVKTIARI